MQNWPKAPVENALSERHEQHIIERVVAAACSESQELPASSKEKASYDLEQWKACARESSAISRWSVRKTMAMGVRPGLPTACGNQSMDVGE